MSYSARELIAERRLRRVDGLRMLRVMEPGLGGVPESATNQVQIYESQATELLVRGGNRASKSFCVSSLVAAIARDIPVQTTGGRLIDCRRSWQKDRPLRIWIIGIQLNHIGQTLHRLLFRAGAYKIIEDAETGEWRAFRPWDPADEARSHEAKMAPPLIPPSEIDHWDWENKASYYFNSCILKNGTEIHAFASSGEVKAGDPVDLIWIDERIRFPAYYDEWRMRLLDLDGRLVWSSKAYDGNPAMQDVTDRAAGQAEEVAQGTRETVDVQEILLDTNDNPYLPESARRKAMEAVSDIGERFLGEYKSGSAIIYPYFDRDLHSAIPRFSSEYDALAIALLSNNGFPPNDWTHYFALDPGTIKPAGIFGAVPPPSLWGGKQSVLVIYDEIYGKRMDAAAMAKAVKNKTPEGRVYRQFIIDMQMGRQQTPGASLRVEALYAEEFEKLSLRSTDTGSSFLPGIPDFQARRMVMDQMLELGESRRPRLLVVMSRCPNLVWQMEHNHYPVDDLGRVDDSKPATKQKDDVREACEYMASRRPKYYEPPRVSPVKKDPYQELQSWWGQRFGHRTQELPQVCLGGSR